MKKYLKAVVSGLCAAALALGCVSGSSARKVLEYGLSDLAAADRETVEQRIAEGQRAAAEEAECLPDARFEAWYQESAVSSNSTRSEPTEHAEEKR